MNLMLSGVGIVLYVVFALAISGLNGSQIGSLVLAVLLVPIGYWNQAANAVVQGHRPVALALSGILSEAGKLLVAFPALLVFRAGIDGVILAIIAANFAQAASSTYLVRDANALPFDLSRGRRWFSHSWLPSLSTLPYVLGVADTFVASVVSHGTMLVAYYQAAFAVATIAGYSFYLATAVYPLMLRGGSDKVVAASLDLTLMFGIPMAAGAAALAGPILFVLRPTYVQSSTALMILAFSALVWSISWVLDQVLMGKESVDADESVGFGELVHSNLFFVSIIDIATAVTYLTLVALVIAVGMADGLPQPVVIDYWAVAQLATYSCYAALKVNRARRGGRLVIGRSLINYAVGSALMAAFLLASSPFLTGDLGAFNLGARLVFVGVVGLGIYGGFLLAVDRGFRRLFRSVARPILG
jgi:hypothetical protein